MIDWYRGFLAFFKAKLSIGTLADNDLLAYDSTSGAWKDQTAAEAGLATASHTHALDDLSDVVVTTPADNDLVAYDTGTSKFINQTATAAGVQPLHANLTAIAGLAITDSNIIVGNGSTFVAESGDTARISLGVGSSDSPQFTAVNIGHASDTTLTRTGAGDLAIEGNAIYRAGGTDVPLTDGGTGASDAATARTNLGVAAAAHTHAMDDLSDVTTGTPSDNYIIAWNSGTSQYTAQSAADVGLSENGHTHNLNALENVTLDTVADNELLAYNDATSEWINQTAAEAGVAVSGHTHTFADISNYTAFGNFTPVWTASASMTISTPTVAWAKNQVIEGGLHFTLEAYSGTIGGTASDTIYFTIPTGINSSSGGGTCALRDGDGAYTTGVWGATSSNRIYIMKTSRANFALGSYFGVDLGGLVGKS